MTERIFEEIMVKKFPTLKKINNLYILEVQQTGSRINSKRFTARLIYSSCQKTKTKRARLTRHTQEILNKLTA